MALVAGSLGIGCAGTDTGNPTDPGPARPPREDFGGEKHCVAVVTVIGGLDHPSPLGISGQEVLAWAEGHHEIDIEWLRPADLDFGPDDDEGRLRIDIALGDGPVRHWEVTPREGGREDFACASYLTVPVHVTLSTSDGALDQRFDAQLRAFDRDAAELAFRWEPDAWLGAPAGVEPDDLLAEWTLVAAHLESRFDASGVAGTLTFSFERLDDGAVSQRVVPVARWGEADVLGARSDAHGEEVE